MSRVRWLRDAPFVVAWLASLWLAASPCGAGEESLATDRPDFTETTSAMAPGFVQVEAGFTFERDDDVDAYGLPELLLRIGLFGRTELRLGAPDQMWVREGSANEFARGDAVLGLKLEASPRDFPVGLALIPSIGFPTQDTELNDAVAQLILAWSRELSGGRSLGGILGHAWAEGARPGERDVLFPTVAFGTPLGGRVGAFFEWSAEFRDGERAAHLFHHGYTLGLSPDLQLDLHVGLGLTDPAPDFFLGAGFGWRRGLF